MDVSGTHGVRSKTMKKNHLIVRDDALETAEYLLQYINLLAEKSCASRNNFLIALSGGKTPECFMNIWAGHGYEFWDKTHLFSVDERYVAKNHNASNSKLIDKIFIQSGSLSKSNFHSIEYSDDINQSVASYEKELNKFIEFPEKYIRFDCVVLGIGEDGHTASLFPENYEINRTSNSVLAVTENTPHYKRMSLSLSCINNARNVVFYVTGKEKAKVVRKVLLENDAKLPAALVEPEDGELLFLLDKDAASFL